jgi:uncharacterized sodium:solute symporter family permease YidK
VTPPTPRWWRRFCRTASRHGGLRHDRGADGVAGSKFNASATLFTMDFYREWYPNARQRPRCIVGRIATAVIVFLGICWVLVIKRSRSNLYEYLQNVQGYLSPAIAVLVFFGRVLETRHRSCRGLGVPA